MQFIILEPKKKREFEDRLTRLMAEALLTKWQDAQKKDTATTRSVREDEHG